MKRRLLFIVVCLLVLFLALTVTTFAEAPRAQAVEISVVVDNDANWKTDVTLKDVAGFVPGTQTYIASPELTLTGVDQATLATLGIQVPSLKPYLDMAEENGIGRVAFKLSTEHSFDFEAVINESAVAQVKASDAMMAKLVGQELPASVGEMTLELEFPSELAPKRVYPTLAQQVSPSDIAVQVGTTVRREGSVLEIVSIGGMPATEVNTLLASRMGGAVLPNIAPPPMLLGLLGDVKHAQLYVGRNGAKFDDSNGGTLEVLWDDASRETLLSFMPLLAEFGVSAPPTEMVSLASTTVGRTDITFDVYVDEAPREQAPKLRFRNVNLALKDGMLSYEGVQLMPINLPFKSAALTLDGLQILPTIDGQDLPAIRFEEGMFGLLGGQAKDLPVTRIADLVRNTEMSVSITEDGTPPAVRRAVAMQANARPAARLIDLAVDVDGDGGIALAGTNVTSIAQRLVPQATLMSLHQSVIPYGQSVSIAADPSILTVSIDERPMVSLLWDSQSRAALVTIGMEQALGYVPQLPLGLETILPDWKAAAGDAVAGKYGPWRVTLRAVDKCPPQSGLLDFFF